MSDGEFVHKDRMKIWMKKNDMKMTDTFTSPIPSISI